MISLDVYGDVGNELYAAVWVQRIGPAFVAIHQTNLAGLESFINTYSGQGYAPRILAATGGSSGQTFAAVLEQTYPVWYWYVGIPNGSPSTPGTFQYYDATLRSQNYLLATSAIYGDPGSPVYIAAWVGNGLALQWADRPLDTATTLTNGIASEKQAGYRPVLISRDASGDYASIYAKNSVGNWVEQHELSDSAYRSLYASQTAQGYFPISVRAGGSTSKPIFAAVFAKTDIPIPPPRSLTITGTAVSLYAPIENAIVSFVKTNGVRAGQLTVAKNGAVQYQRAFTWAESGYPITQVSSLMRLASVSKAFLEAAVQTLYNTGKLKPTTLVFPTLGFHGPKDPRSDTITVQQLLDHQGGYDDTNGNAPDWVFSMRNIANQLGLSQPITKAQFVTYVYGQPLQFTPGTKSVYSNTGYAILSFLVEHVTGQTFFNYLSSAVMAPLGVTSGFGRTNTAKSKRLPGEVAYEDNEVGFSALAPTSNVLIPFPYGGDQLLYEVADGPSGICATATVVTTLIHKWLVWGNGPRPPTGNWYLQRDGSMPGTTSVAASRGKDGVDFCFAFNTRNWPLGSSVSPPDDLANQINSFLDSLGI